MEELETRELRYFVAVAEELNITRAAERLGMAQPPLSRAIRLLERRLGVPLLDRTGNRITLTEAGETLLEEARAALDAVTRAAVRTRRTGRRGGGLVVTAKPGLATELLKRIVARYTERNGPAAAEIVVSGYGRQAGMVRAGTADLALLCPPLEPDGLDTEVLASEPRVLAVPVGHELAERDEVRCDDLDGQVMPVWEGLAPAEVAYWTGRDAGDPRRPGPRTGPRVADVEGLLEVVGLGQGVALVPRSLAARHTRPDVVYRPVADATPYDVILGWPRDSRSRTVAEFVKVAAEVAAEWRPAS